MNFIFEIIVCFFDKIFCKKSDLIMENLALRQQLAIYSRTVKKPKLKKRDRFFWVFLFKIWNNWPSALIIVKPDTVIKWHKLGFKLFWRWKSRQFPIGRPMVNSEIRDLIRRMSKENITWGAPRIFAELKLLGYDIAKSTVEKYMVKSTKPPSQTWRTFINNHMHNTAAIDFFTVPTATFKILYCFFVLSHDRRKVLHFNITEHPTAEWTIQQIREAFPYDETPKYLIMDRDSIYSTQFKGKVKNMGINLVPTAAKSPWQNPFAERMIGSARKDCLNHVIVFNQNHLRNILRRYFDYYHKDRPHHSLEKNSPIPREFDPPANGKIYSIPKLGGLHHLYRRAA